MRSSIGRGEQGVLPDAPLLCVLPTFTLVLMLTGPLGAPVPPCVPLLAGVLLGSGEGVGVGSGVGWDVGSGVWPPALYAAGCCVWAAGVPVAAAGLQVIQILRAAYILP